MLFLIGWAAAKAAEKGVTSADTFLVLPAILLGLVISLVEMGFVHADERGMGWMAHGLHAVPVTMAFTFVTMNVPYALKLANIHAVGAWVEPVVIVVIGIIAMAKVLTAAAIAGKVGEKKYHVFLIGLLIIAAPYAWKYFLAAAIGPILPQW
ncbi:MAG: hypothetical protein ABIH41_01195 [Nanoarchaeota archaeon]